MQKENLDIERREKNEEIILGTVSHTIREPAPSTTQTK
jgi:hypothetical protein